MKRTQSPEAGFTLLELIITLAILTILSTFVTQGWSRWVNQSRQRALLEDYHAIFAYARWTAASTRSLVTLCPLSDQNRCVDDWTRPVSVFTDRNNDKKPDNDRILRTLAPDFGTFSLRSRTAGRGYFQFNEKGMTHGAMGSLVLCPKDATTGTMTYMPVNLAGRFRVQYDRDADGIIRLSWGGKISC
ncbi:MAG: GspH/FimT family pseudopilin [Marinobacter sp.]|nr:GspH/FimT family pseudopilin [Marinobacter sp.]